MRQYTYFIDIALQTYAIILKKTTRKLANAIIPWKIQNFIVSLQQKS